MSLYIKLHNQQQFFDLLLATLKLSQAQAARLFDMPKTTMSAYCRREIGLPKSLFIYLCSFAKLDIKTFKGTEYNASNSEKKIKIPVLDKYLANFLGILAGDGHVSDYCYEVSVVGDKDLDKQFLSKHVFCLFEKLFGLEPHFKLQDNALTCRVYSKKLMELLNKTYNVPLRKKKNKLHIPNVILKNKILLKSYLRGVFDTDGSFHRHHKNTAAVEIISGDVNFLEEIKQSLTSLDFNPCKSGKSVYLYRSNEIHRFFREISSDNEKHLKKYHFYKTRGYLPLQDKLMRWSYRSRFR